MKLYNELAEWWPLMQPPRRFKNEAARLARRLRNEDEEAETRPTLLQLGSGGGHLASHLKEEFDMTLVDLSPRMLGLSRTLNPECRHLEGDMRTLRLDERFDAVLIFDAIAHIIELEDLQATLETARAHLRPGGRAIFCPDWTLETYEPGVSTGGSDSNGRGMRYIEWNHPWVEGTSCETDIAYLLRYENGDVRVEHDHIRIAVFPEETWRNALEEAGFTDVRIRQRTIRLHISARAA